jgi:hypothetical protein
MATELHEIYPVLYSHEECEWLIDNLDKPPAVALRNLPAGVNIKQVKPLLDRVQELEQLKAADGLKWIGVEEVKSVIRTYLAQDAKWASDAKRMRSAPRFPSLYSFDSKGRPHLGGPGSDSGRVRTYFDAQGNRVPFAKTLITDWAPEWAAPAGASDEKLDSGLIDNDQFNRWECFCGHTEQYKAGSRSSKNAARARLSKHLRKATEEVDRHREIHTNVFGQASL